MNVMPLALFDVVAPEVLPQGAPAPLPFAALLMAATPVAATPAAAVPEVVTPVAPAAVAQAALAPETGAHRAVAIEAAPVATGAPPVLLIEYPLPPAQSTQRLQPQPQTFSAQRPASSEPPSPRRVAAPDADLPVALAADADADVDVAEKRAPPEERRAEPDAPLAVADIAVQPHTANRNALPRALALSAVPVGQPAEAGAVLPEAPVQSRRQSPERRLAQNGPDLVAVTEPVPLPKIPVAVPMPVPVASAAPAAPAAAPQPAAEPVAARQPLATPAQAAAVAPLVSAAPAPDLSCLAVPAQVQVAAATIVSQSPIGVTADEAPVEATPPELPTQRKAADPVAVSAAQNPAVAAAPAPSAGRTALMQPREAIARPVVQAVPPRLKEAVAQSLPPQRDEPVAQRRMPPRPMPQQIADIAAAPPALQQPDIPEPVATLPRAVAAPAAREPTQVETEALGNVTIALDRRDAALHVHFTVDRASTAHALLDSARLLDGALQAGGTRLDQLSVDVRGGDVRSGAATGADTRAPASHSDGGGQRPPTRDPRAQDTPRPFQPAPPPRHAQTSAHDRFA